MATFPIYEDTEKENPKILKGPSKQPNHVQKRSGFVTLNSNNVGNGLQAARGGATNKLALRQAVTNNINNNNKKKTSKDSKVVAAQNIGQKKSAVVPVVEQFKTFSVYEDNNANENEQPTIKEQQNLKQKSTTTALSSKSITTKVAVATTIAAAATTAINNLKNINDENDYELENQQIAIKNDSLHKNFDGIVEDDVSSVFNTTPMSVSDVLSPMSVDRSLLSTIDPEDKENQGDLLLLQQRQRQQETNDFNLLATANDNQQQHQEKDKQQQQNQNDVPNVKQQRDMIPLPRNDRQRFFEVVEYQMDILEYFRESEKKHLPKPNYMRRQQDINYSMRTILVDWLVEVSEEYNLDTETLYLSISYIDRFLSQMSVVRSKLQLVGTAAMYIAAKYEEIYPPDVGEFVFITDDTYTKAQVLRMEQLILKILAFDLCTPTTYVFVNTYAVLTDMTFDLKFLTMYICELSLLEVDPYLRFVPSLVSAAAHALARYILDYAIWTAELEEVTKYKLEDLKEVFLHLCKTHEAASKIPQQAIQEKYKGKKYNAVATLKPVQFTPEQFDEITAKYNEVAANEKANLEQQQAMIVANNENVRRMISLMFN